MKIELENYEIASVTLILGENRLDYVNEFDSGIDKIIYDEKLQRVFILKLSGNLESWPASKCLIFYKRKV